jgi:hypothetical protein
MAAMKRMTVRMEFHMWKDCGVLAKLMNCKMQAHTIVK